MIVHLVAVMSELMKMTPHHFFMAEISFLSLWNPSLLNDNAHANHSIAEQYKSIYILYVIKKRLSRKLDKLPPTQASNIVPTLSKHGASFWDQRVLSGAKFREHLYHELHSGHTIVLH
jgi:hypothetical protein